MSFWNGHDEIWNQLAQELKGQFQDGGWFERDTMCLNRVRSRVSAPATVRSNQLDRGGKSGSVNPN